MTSEKIGVVGFCMGGALSLYTATKNPHIGACVVFYGGHPNVKPDLPNLHAPVLGLYAEKDGFVTPDLVRELESKLKALGKRSKCMIYPEAITLSLTIRVPRFTTLKLPPTRGSAQSISFASILV